MPDWSQLLCCPRRRSPKPRSVVSSPGLDHSHALSSRLGSSEDVATSTSYIRNPLNRTPIDSPASRQATPIGAAGSILGSHESVVQLAPPSDDAHSAQAQQDLAPPPSPYELAIPSQQSFHAETTTRPAGRDSPQPPQQKGMFDRAQNFSMTNPTFVDGNVTNINNTIASKFMEKLLKETIRGAESDSSARYPPPRCHPGTRLNVLKRCIHFIANCDGATKIRWVVGGAGAGKSAIMQSVADSPNLRVTCHVSIFFSINGRNDGTKAIITLSYQLAAKSAPYRQFIECEIACDPSLLQASMSVQFQKFIIEPFIQSQLLNSPERILIIIDGLDECTKRGSQLELLRLISDFCITYPFSPLVWFVASRPEQHITSFFARADVMPAYEKEEIQVDSNDGRADVERFLRARLEEIKSGSYSFDSHSKWPEEKNFWKLAEAAGGLFAYADTVIKYIGDLSVGNPISQFSNVLKVIDNHPMTDIPPEYHPMALLDAMYARILSKIPAKVTLHAREIILSLASGWDKNLGVDHNGTFVELCNWLGMTPDEAYAAVNQLQSLLRIPKGDQAHLESLEPIHQSFIDYVSDSSRSNFFTDMNQEARQVETECLFRVLNEAPDGVVFGDVDYRFPFGTLRRGPGTGDKVSLIWPVDGCDGDTQLNMYILAIGAVTKWVQNEDPTFTSEFCIRIFITQFEDYHNSAYGILCELVFDKFRRHEYMRCGILKQMPLKTVPGSLIHPGVITLEFRRPARAVEPGVSTAPNAVELSSRCPAREVTSLSDPWNSSCKHERNGEWEEGNDQVWQTLLDQNIYTSSRSKCKFCYERFERQLKSIRTRSPDHTVTVLFTYAGDCCVEFQFVDPDDGISEWTYWYWIEISPEERKKLGSTV